MKHTVWLVLLIIMGCGSKSGKTPAPPPPPPPPPPGPVHCFITTPWALPTEYEDGSPIGATDLTVVTLYLVTSAGPRELDLDAYLLTAETMVDEGDWSVTATVTAVNEEVSERSNEVGARCE